MCYHKSLVVKYQELMDHFSVSFASITPEMELLKVPYLALKPRYENELKKLQEEGLYDPMKSLGRQPKAYAIMKELFTLQELDFVRMFDKAKSNFSKEGVTRYHENGYDYLPMPVLTTQNPSEFKLYQWGLIPGRIKDYLVAKETMARTLNCRSEEMFDKDAWRQALKNGQRCLIPITGFYEWKRLDEKGKKTIPFFISTSDQRISSLAGVFNSWKDPATGKLHHTYAVITTEANMMMAEIHNSKKRMPVIIPKASEKDWLNPSLSKDDVLDLCRPYDTDRMKAYTVSRKLSEQNVETNVPEILEEIEYKELHSSDEAKHNELRLF